MFSTKHFVGFIVGLSMISLAVSPAMAGGGKRLILNLVGQATAFEADVPNPDNNGLPISAFCYEVDLFNAKNAQKVGTATDCLSNFSIDGNGVALVGTTTFELAQGTITTQGRTTVRPEVNPQADITTPSGQTITHITGSATPGNSIIEGTKRFANATGTVRLSGLVDLTNFNDVDGGQIFFDCLFVIDLD